MKRVRAKDVAAAAGVSPSAVSQAFGGYGRINAETKERIFRIARELGYRPAIPRVTSEPTRVVGVLMGIMGDPTIRLLAGIEQGLAERNCVPLMLGSDKSKSEELQIGRLLEHQVAGIIMRPMRDSIYPEKTDLITQYRIPLVTIDSPRIEGKMPHFYVGTNDRTGGELAARHLLELGHRKLGILTAGDYPQPMFFRQRGFEQEAEKTPDASVFTVKANFNKPARGARQILKLNPTAIFATMDNLLPALYNAARDEDIRIPADLSVIGFSNDRLTEYLSPQATSMAQPFEEIGRRAVDLLFEQIAGSGSPGQVIRLAPEVSVKESTCPPS